MDTITNHELIVGIMTIVWIAYGVIQGYSNIMLCIILPFKGRITSQTKTGVFLDAVFVLVTMYLIIQIDVVWTIIEKIRNIT